MNFGTGRGRGGFSLIEILIATTILLVIVVLASLVFQQTTGAYQTGERKVNAQVALRNIIGSMTRDLALAVDAADYPGVQSECRFTGGSMTFIALTGKPGIDAAGNDNEKSKDCRTAHIITYSTSGKRTEQALGATVSARGEVKWGRKGEQVEAELFDSASYEGVGSIDITFDYVWPDGASASTLPERIYIRAELESDGSVTTVGAGSGGRRGWGSPDEIYVGYKP